MKAFQTQRYIFGYNEPKQIRTNIEQLLLKPLNASEHVISKAKCCHRHDHCQRLILSKYSYLNKFHFISHFVHLGKSTHHRAKS